MDHEAYMLKALELAREAAEAGEVPVGCIIAKEGNIVGKGRNRMEELNCAAGHAELEAIKNACAALGDWRLAGCTLYVTLEPCPMCAGAIINSRIPKIYFGAKDLEKGSCGSVLNLFEENFGHHPAIVGGILSAECSGIISEFFLKLRNSTT